MSGHTKLKKNKIVCDNHFTASININALKGLSVISMSFLIVCEGLVYQNDKQHSYDYIGTFIKTHYYTKRSIRIKFNLKYVNISMVFVCDSNVLFGFENVFLIYIIYLLVLSMSK